ncbi:hypothetical protein EJB05_35193, partial [Eragrostis curvula]
SLFGVRLASAAPDLLPTPSLALLSIRSSLVFTPVPPVLSLLLQIRPGSGVRGACSRSPPPVEVEEGGALPSVPACCPPGALPKPYPFVPKCRCAATADGGGRRGGAGVQLRVPPPATGGRSGDSSGVGAGRARAGIRRGAGRGSGEPATTASGLLIYGERASSEEHRRLLHGKRLHGAAAPPRGRCGRRGGCRVRSAGSQGGCASSTPRSTASTRGEDGSAALGRARRIHCLHVGEGRQRATSVVSFLVRRLPQGSP